MRSRFFRESTLGIFILVVLGALAGVLLWQRGLRLGGRGFSFTIELEDASGLDVGSPLRYRGIQVGSVKGVEAATGKVRVNVEVDDSDLAMPVDSVIETNQSGFLASTAIDIFPQTDLDSAPDLDPLAQDCNSDLIICQGSVVFGTTGVDFTKLLRDSTEALERFGDEEFLGNLNSTLLSITAAADDIAALARSANNTIVDFDVPITEFADSAAAITRAADQVSLAATSADSLILENKEQLAQTLDSISAASEEAQRLIASAQPLLDDGQLSANLKELSSNAAQTAANLRELSDQINDPNTIIALRETLDSARATFANTQKITADLDELTGDPRFRDNIRSLVDGLSGLLSSAEEIELLPATILPEELELDNVAKLKSGLKLATPDEIDQLTEFETQKINNDTPDTSQSPAIKLDEVE
ncbi:Mammalian cell entry related domain protein [Thalassoporum mexicanum PCC 7367]|uniref:MlaD family protein n=1 Tax=Thalassoporum mexicanum TaxID=3457544 RepID=UPI00029F9986|nr:MlaD family protein [Pseudanabaena sp. PCC 7367]AFY69543.1 Mammalian cell entry related domain protein [Pseudanabaena sp. PCC 7367]